MSKPFDIVWTSQFKKDYKLAMKRNKDINLLDDVIHSRNFNQSLPFVNPMENAFN